MFNPFKRLAADPSQRFYKSFNRLTDKDVLKIYPPTKGEVEVEGVTGFDSVVRLNSTYLELVDRYYEWRGTKTLVAGGIFGIAFIGCFLIPLFQMVCSERIELRGIIAMTVAWVIMVLPASWISYKILICEFFFSTYYPIRFNRKNGMVYVYQAGGKVLAVPWREIRFVLYGEKSIRVKTWSILGCITAEDGETVTGIIPLPVDLHWGPKSLDMYWEFIRCYMEEGDEYLPDLADTVPWCPPLEQQKEGWLFGLLYLCRQTGRLGLLLNLLQFPFLFAIAFSRWLVMLTCKIPQWPADIATACQIAENDPVNKGPEDNPPQLWRPMLALQGKKRYAQTFAKERGAMERIIARLKAKYGEQGKED
ncbi:TPA: hypothetical protein PPN70_000913 [Serratia rubidaea]|nr:hypothetical protein [Serratia rubidaea]HDJ1447688.1 hypothetical protein [Serratia rubidaea]HDJ1460745.1 hypothetical protein [Serratia rubidaea]HDJ2771079.1 hypothetical protein [Serratia rubidaea]